jgi:hypothetical protein
MNKIVLSLLALGAMTGAAFAEAGDLDREGLADTFASDVSAAGSAVAKPLAVQTGSTAFERARLDAKMELSDR